MDSISSMISCARGSQRPIRSRHGNITNLVVCGAVGPARKTLATCGRGTHHPACTNQSHVHVCHSTRKVFRPNIPLDGVCVGGNRDRGWIPSRNMTSVSKVPTAITRCTQNVPHELGWMDAPAITSAAVSPHFSSGSNTVNQQAEVAPRSMTHSNPTKRVVVRHLDNSVSQALGVANGALRDA